MFYPAESLKRGGRFYLCWLADSWPVQFAALSQKQLWSYDIRKLCDDMMEVVTSESGRPANRYSLRLSSRLVHGLVKVYEKKANLLLSELCMISAQVFRHANKKYTVHVQGQVIRVPRPMPLELPRPELDAEPDQQRVEEMIQNSSNVVANIQDITLKEATIPQIQLPPNDGFGEEHPDVMLQQLLHDHTAELNLDLDLNPMLQMEHIGERTVEQMLHQADTSAAQHSILELEVDRSHKSNAADRSRVVIDRQMERISECHVPMIDKSAAPEPMELDIEKYIPEISEMVPPQPPVIPDPDIPEVPQIVISEPEAPPAAPKPAAAAARAAPRQREQDVDIELEELEQGSAARRRRARRLIVDRCTVLNTDYFRARIQNIHVEQRCEDVQDDIVNTHFVPFETLSKRPAHAGHRLQARGSNRLLAMFQQRLVTEHRPYCCDTQSPEADGRSNRRKRSLPNVPEEPEQQLEPRVEPPIPESGEADKTRGTDGVPNISDCMNVTEVVPNLEQTINVPLVDITLRDVPQVQPNQDIQPMDVQAQMEGTCEQPLDVCDMPTQVLQVQRLSQQSNNSNHKRASQEDRPAKKSKPIGVCSFLESLMTPNEHAEKENIPPEANKENIPTDAYKENIPPEDVPVAPEVSRQSKNVTTMLREAGIADIIEKRRNISEQAPPSQVQSQPRARTRVDTEDSEPGLGSLDRTQVSVGDSDHSTESQRFIRNHWGIEGTMVKIIDAIKRGSDPITVHTLIQRGPTMPGLKGQMAAWCFSSILKLKQHGFIKVTKHPETLAIVNITLGPEFDDIEV